MKAKLFLISAATSVSLLASIGLAAAQNAPENRDSTTMERDGGHSDLALKATHGRGMPRYLHTGRSVHRSLHRHYRRHE